MIEKIAIIRKLPNGKYQVQSRKGKNLGTYDSKGVAEKRLKQVEMFKYLKSKRKKAISLMADLIKEAEDNKKTYSSIVRELRQSGDKEKLSLFMSTFKKSFDDAFLENIEDPAEPALLASVKAINYKEKLSQAVNDRLLKLGQASLQMGDPVKAGKGIADIIRFMTSRINPLRRAESLHKLRLKIQSIDPFELAGKKTPATASLGQSLTFLKTILIGNGPIYIKRILEEVVRNL